MKFLAWIKSYLDLRRALRYRKKKQCVSSRKVAHGCRAYLTGSHRRATHKYKSTRIAIKRYVGLIVVARALPAFMEASSPKSDINLEPHQAKFDSDSFLIGIDNHASVCIFNNKDHAITDIVPWPTTRKEPSVMDFGGGTSAIKGQATIRWQLEDDAGQIDAVDISGAAYVPSAPYCILSPQHWAQQSKDDYPRKRGTWCATYGDCCVLQWRQRSHTKTIQHDPRSNVPKFRTAPGTTLYRVSTAVLDEIHGMEELEHVCYQTSVISETESEEEHHHHQDELEDAWQYAHGKPPNQTHLPSNTTSTKEPSPQRTTPHLTTEENVYDFMQGHPKPVDAIPEEEEYALAATTDKAELLRWHYRLNHLSWTKLRLLSLVGILPRKLASIRPPKCSGCLYGTMTKRPWRTKTKQSVNKIKPAKAPGECVSVDQLESSTPGFVAQLKGKLTRKRYKAATIFVDHFSDVTFVYEHERLTSEETVAAKIAFEAWARDRGVVVQHYHADNGRFADNAFIRHCQSRGQTISYCAVNAHWQNGRAEKRIRDVQEETRKNLLHGQARWPEAVTVNLWPYALRSAVDVRNTLPDKPDGSCPLSRFARSEVQARLKDKHPPFCPVYILQTQLQNRQAYPKWEARARLGMNLGPSPKHARNVNLVMNLDTGLVSPQFHVQYDDFFESVRPGMGHLPTISKWQESSGLRSSPNKPSLSEGALRMISHVKRKNKDREQSIQQPSVETTELQPDLPPQPPEEVDVFHPVDDPQEPSQEEQVTTEQTREVAHEPLSVEQPPIQPARQSTRKRIMTQKAMESFQQRDLNENVIFCAEYYDQQMIAEEQIAYQTSDPIAFASSNDPDTMYYHQAMRQPDRDEFVKAIIKEVNGHIEGDHWEMIPLDEVPKGTKVLDAVWGSSRHMAVGAHGPYSQIIERVAL
jgi:hypothetical protein